MARRSRFKWTEACGEHKPLRSHGEALAAMVRHPSTACPKCRRGKLLSTWRCGEHHHVGHQADPRTRTA